MRMQLFVVALAIGSIWAASPSQAGAYGPVNPLPQGELDTSGLSIGEDCKTNLSRSPGILQSGVCPRVG